MKKYTIHALGTIINIQIMRDNIDKIINYINNFEKRGFIYISTIEISKINKNNGKSIIRVSPDTIYIIKNFI